ncbi:MAG TPA: hypothetical protein VIX90_07910 [Edaphobacter sp.]
MAGRHSVSVRPSSNSLFAACVTLRATYSCIDDATETVIERVLGSSSTRSKVRYRAWLVMMTMQDTGMRPERRIWIPSGKTAKARRFVGMTERTHSSCRPGAAAPKGQDGSFLVVARRDI